MSTLIIAVVFVILIFFQMSLFFKSYIKCPPDKLLVIFGKVSENPDEKYKVFTSGATFVWPIIQDYFLIDANPMEILIDKKFRLQDGQQTSLKIKLVCKVSKDENLVITAAELFYKKEKNKIIDFIKLSLNESIRKELNSSSNINEKAIENLMSETLNKLGVEMIALEAI